MALDAFHHYLIVVLCSQTAFSVIICGVRGYFTVRCEVLGCFGSKKDASVSNDV